MQAVPHRPVAPDSARSLSRQSACILSSREFSESECPSKCCRIPPKDCRVLGHDRERRDNQENCLQQDQDATKAKGAAVLRKKVLHV